MNTNCECIVSLISLSITIVGFLIAFSQLKHNLRAKNISNLIALKNELRFYDEIHKKLLPNNEFNFEEINQDDFVSILGYLGVFELAFVMLKKRNLTRELFMNFFSYRLQNIKNNESLYNYILSDKESWKYTISLIDDFTN